VRVTDLINLSAYCGSNVLDPLTEEPIAEAALAKVFPESLAALELSTRPTVRIPEDLVDAYASYRPSPMFEAKRFAAALRVDAQILVKDEGATPSGNHKMNSAMWIAYHCARDGISTITTETTGNWGTALALAASRFGVRVICFMDQQSADARPDREELMRRAGADVIVVGSDEEYDPLVLSANRAVSYTREQPDARYVFGSVYNYFITPQTVTGIEAREEMGDDGPDVVVGSCGGGANLLGIAGAFLVDAMESGTGPEVVCAEAEQCPIVSAGKPGLYSIDDQDYYPKLRTYGLDRLLGNEYIGGLGSTLVAAAVARLHQEGLIQTLTLPADEAASAARLFAETEGRRVALETGYQLAAVAAVARDRGGGRILVNCSMVDRGSYA
jgi:tryptophan synthase beta chain